MLMSCEHKADLIRLVTLDPGHFHAALVQKVMLPGVDSTVHVYAPKGRDLDLHLERIKGYNSRKENPTQWRMDIYSRPDFFDRMIADKRGNVVVLAGNNKNKTEYIRRSLETGFDVLADKPMVITPDQLPLLKASFEIAERDGRILYDMMTERFEINTVIQRELSMIPEIFGEFEKGTTGNPSVVKESVHHFFKSVSGTPLIRPYWFMDVDQQGNGIVDVTTHLVDLVQWTCFPEQVLNFEKDVRFVSAERWPTTLTRSQFSQITGLVDFPADLSSVKVNDSTIGVYSNGVIDYELRGIAVRVKVEWAFEAGEGRGDTHYSHLNGTRSRLVIRQGAEQEFKPKLYIEPAQGLRAAEIESGFERVRKKFPGVELKQVGSIFEVYVPPVYHIGHEAHFAQVLQKFLEYRKAGKLPEWEHAGMMVKYELLMRSLMEL